MVVSWPLCEGIGQSQNLYYTKGNCGKIQIKMLVYLDPRAEK
jgi:hypothetical protein